MPKARKALDLTSGNKPNAKKTKSFDLDFLKFGAGNEIRTRDPNLGKVVLYQLSYSRVVVHIIYNFILMSNTFCKKF